MGSETTHFCSRESFLMDQLPFDLFTFLLVQHLDIPSIISLSLTCKKYYEYILKNDSTQLLWKEILDQQISFWNYNCDPNTNPVSSTTTSPNTTNAKTNNNTNPNTNTPTHNDWRKIVREGYVIQKNWKYGKAVTTNLPGNNY